MIVCPRCAYPYMGEAYVVSERTVQCSRCNWVGSSTELLNVAGDNVVNPQVFDEFYTFLHKSVSPVMGRKMIQLGIVPRDKTVEGAKYLGGILQEISKAVIGTVIKEVLGGERES